MLVGLVALVESADLLGSAELAGFAGLFLLGLFLPGLLLGVGAFRAIIFFSTLAPFSDWDRFWKLATFHPAATRAWHSR